MKLEAASVVPLAQKIDFEACREAPKGDVQLEAQKFHALGSNTISLRPETSLVFMDPKIKSLLQESGSSCLPEQLQKRVFDLLIRRRLAEDTIDRLHDLVEAERNRHRSHDAVPAPLRCPRHWSIFMQCRD